jgi:dihydroxyacetone kinase DhaKLM complex PTS-EIIA-like component DhaM
MVKPKVRPDPASACDKVLAQRGLGGLRVLLADAPFVEGTVAATVTAAAGGDVKAVAAAAEEARHVRKL